MKIETLKNKLREQGFYVDNLWCIDDVKTKFNCTDEEAYEVLDKALQNQATMEQIWLAIQIEGEAKNLTETRICYITREPMTKGFVFGDGDLYIKHEVNALNYIIENSTYKTLKDSYENGFHNYTEWE